MDKHSRKDLVLLKCLVALVLVAGFSTTSVAAVIYNVDRTVASGRITGTIETNGATGVLTSADIIDWNLTVDADGDPATFGQLLGPLSGNNSSFAVSGSVLTATPTALFFDFSITDFDILQIITTAPGPGVVWQLQASFPIFSDELIGDTFSQAFVTHGQIKEQIATAAVADYDFQLIEDTVAPDTQVLGINDSGDAVGIGFDRASPLPTARPFVYESRTGTFTDVAPACGFANTAILGIADSGVIVGSVRSLDLSTTSGMIRGKDGTFTIFSHPQAPSFTQARGVNNAGLVSGFRDTSAAGIRAAFIYNPMTDTFTDFVEASFTVAHGINSRGDVVGNAFFFGTDDPCPGFPSTSANYGWLRAADGSITFFQVNGQSTRARGINDEGSIVGFVNDSGKFKGFVVKLDGLPCESLTVAGSDLLEFPGFDSTLPEGITNSGVIVGIVIDADGFQHGFIATPR